MRQETKLESYVLAAAMALSLAVSASAQSPDPSMAVTDPVVTGSGQLGSAYSEAAYTYDHLASSSPSERRGFTLAYNQPLQAGLDFTAGYDWGRAENYRLRLTQQNLRAGVTAFTAFDWGKPYVQALAGWEWVEGNGPAVNSLAYTVGTGVEFQVAPPLVLTPFANFVRATGFNQDEIDYGVKSAYRLNREWSLVARAQYDAVRHFPDRAGYSIGTDYHF